MGRNPAAVAYEAYREAAGGKSLVTGAPIPEWANLPEPIRKAWWAAAGAVFDYHNKPAITPAFISGSHAYGAPEPDSDVDLVIFVPDPDDESLLRSFSDEPWTANKGGPIRFGNLNLILCRSADLYGAWREGTDKLVAQVKETRRPVDRGEAIAVLKPLRERLGDSCTPS